MKYRTTKGRWLHLVRPSIFRRIPRLSLQIFLLIAVCVVLPMYAMFSYLRISFEKYMRSEISGQVIQSISKSEQEIYNVLKNLAAASSVIVSNESLAEDMQNGEMHYFQKTVAFDAALASLTANNLFTMEDMIITFFDLEKRVYSNWSTNYYNYRFLLEQDWVQESIDMGGHITWSMFSPGYIIPTGSKRPETYISMARSMLSDGVEGERIGTIIISIEQAQLCDLLARYAYNDSDRIYVCVDGGEILLRRDGDAPDAQPQVRDTFARLESASGSLIDTLDGKQYLVSYYTIPRPWTFNGQQLRVLHYTDYADVVAQVEQISRSLQTSMIFFLLLLLAVTGMVAVRIVKPVQLLERKMHSYSVGTEVAGIDTDRRDEIGSLNRAFLSMSGHITQLFLDLAHEHEVREKYRFESLRAQLNPHFLFNTLCSIRWMTIIRGADNMVQCIDALAGMLKYTMSRGGELSTLQEELQSVRDYVFIQNTRYGDRCNLKVDVGEALLDLRLVKFILQPIVENAILHGIKDAGRRGEERLLLYVEGVACLTRCWSASTIRRMEKTGR